MVWDGRTYNHGNGDMSDGSWLIFADKIPVGAGMYWLDNKDQTDAKAQGALDAQYGKNSFDVRHHGRRFYAWRLLP